VGAYRVRRMIAEWVHVVAERVRRRVAPFARLCPVPRGYTRFHAAVLAGACHLSRDAGVTRDHMKRVR